MDATSNNNNNEIQQQQKGSKISRVSNKTFQHFNFKFNVVFFFLRIILKLVYMKVWNH